MDNLNLLLRKAIIAAWGKTALLTKFKGFVIDKQVLGWMGTTEDKFVRGEWGCGDSSSRLCTLLVGDEMNTGVKDSIDLADDTGVGAAYKEMHKTAGYLLVRLNVYTKGVSHAFIFLSRERAKASSPLEGYIYQTNIALGAANNFDLIDWVNDEKSSEVVFLPGYITELQAQFTGLRQTSADAPKVPLQASRVYEQDFALTNKPLGSALTGSVNTLAQKEIIKSFMSWKPVNRDIAVRNLEAFATL
jgi:hypothetical protein